MQNQALLTPEQAAYRLQVTSRTIAEWLRTGRLRGYRVGRLWRIPEESLDALLGGLVRDPAAVYAAKQGPDSREVCPSVAVTSGRDLLESGLVGMWADRDDVGDSVEFARALREQAQNRRP